MANKKDAIVETAIRRIAEHGSTFTTEQVASDLGCSQSLIFRYYRTKEELMSACFDRVCHELKLILKGVELAPELNRDSVKRYMMVIWDAYCSYLESNTHIARAYMYFVSIGRRYPHGYKSSETVLKKILEDDYHRIIKVYPDFIFVAEYIVMLSNSTATWKFTEWSNDPDVVGKLHRILMNGIMGMDKEG